MNHLRLYENFSRPYYEFNMPEFYNTFRDIFNKEKSIDDKKVNWLTNRYHSEFFLLLNNIIPNWRKIPLQTIIEDIIRLILIDKEVEFFINDVDLKRRSENDVYGRVKKVICYPRIGTDRILSINIDEFIFRIGLYEFNYNWEVVDYNKSIKIYGEKTEIEKYIDLVSDTNKYNI